MKANCKISILLLLCLTSILVSAQQIAPPVIEWQKSLGGSGIDQANTIIRTVDHGYLIVGSTTSNDGDVSGNHGGSDGWVMKLNTSGAIVWQHCFGGSANDYLMHVTECPNGDFVCVGGTLSTDGDATGNHGGSDGWIVRIDKNGNLIWSKVYGSTETESGRIIRRAWDGGYAIGGFISSGGWSDIWIFKIDENGVFQWQNTYGDNNNQEITSMILTSDSAYAISGYVRYNGFPACQALYSWFSAYALKVKQDGTVVWQQNGGFLCGNPGFSSYYIQPLEMPSRQLMYIGERANNSIDNYPHWRFTRKATENGAEINLYHQSTFPNDDIINIGHGPEIADLMPDSTIISGITLLQSSNNNNGTLSLIKLVESGGTIQFLYKKFYGGSGSDYFTSVKALNEGEIIACGNTGSSDGGITGYHGNGDAWVVKFLSLNRIKGRVFVDVNNNGIKDPTEKFLANVKVESAKANSTFANTTDSLGRFLNNVDTGLFSTTVKMVNQYYTVAPSVKQSNFPNYNLSDSFDFALVPIPGIRDLKISLIEENAIRPGFNANYRLVYSNEGPEQVNNVVIKVVKRTSMSFVSSSPTQTSIVNDTVTWNIGTINSLAGGSIKIILNAAAPPIIQIGDRIQLVGIIEPIGGDTTPLNNTDTLSQIVRGSFDPNDKQEHFGGILPPDQLQAKSLLYTIRFQNTGNDTAFTVVIRDTLSAKLELNSIEFVSSSHPVQFNIRDGNKLTWRFDDIKLLNKNENEPASHGFVTFRIKPKSNLVIGDTIKNAASIYFDFNLPVKTNTQLTIIKLAPPPQPNVTGLQSDYCNNQGVQKGKIINLPSASSGTTATAKLDGTIIPIGADSSFSFDVGILSAGTHNLKVIYTNSTASDSVTKAFTTTAATTPDVNVSANITNITSLANPVVVTAANAAGGGTTPLYTFAKERTFTTILQAEGSNNILNINPSNLLVGDNWIYVRMKTSLTCYTTQTNIDSILLKRDAITGIIDVDDPGRVINIYPNPFNRQINVNGLNPTKSYEITIVDLNGKQLLRKQIQNTTQFNLQLRSYPGGMYLLNIYDKRKQRLIGNVRIVKQ